MIRRAGCRRIAARRTWCSAWRRLEQGPVRWGSDRPLPRLALERRRTASLAPKSDQRLEGPPRAAVREKPVRRQIPTLRAPPAHWLHPMARRARKAVVVRPGCLAALRLAAV